MCLIFFALSQHRDYKFVLAGNRDEFYNRKTAPASFWQDHPDLVAGRDLEAMGTWLGMTRHGKISMLTNYRDVRNLKSHAPSRGKLVSDYLIRNVNAEDYIQQVSEVGNEYNGFNLLTGIAESLWYYSNYGSSIRKITEGSFGLSNHLLDTPWPKVTSGKEKFNTILKGSDIETESLFELLFNAEVALDGMLPDTGLPLEKERALSSIFIKTPDYGSRCSTVILIDKDDNVVFSERIYDLKTFDHKTETFRFKILQR